MLGTLRINGEYLVVLTHDELMDMSRAVFLLEILGERLEAGTLTATEGLGERCLELVRQALTAMRMQPYVSQAGVEGEC